VFLKKVLEKSKCRIFIIFGVLVIKVSCSWWHLRIKRKNLVLIENCLWRVIFLYSFKETYSKSGKEGKTLQFSIYNLFCWQKFILLDVINRLLVIINIHSQSYLSMPKLKSSEKLIQADVSLKIKSQKHLLLIKAEIFNPSLCKTKFMLHQVYVKPS